MSSRIRQQLEKSILFIEAHLGEKITAGEVADHACLSVFHFQRVFSAYMGETISQYILHRRLEVAAKKIANQKSLAIADIAIQSGFETHSAFSRAFKKHFDISPSEFRNNPYKVELGKDDRRPFLKTMPSKHENIEVEIQTLPTLWLNHKRTAESIFGIENKQNFLQMNQELEELIDEKKQGFWGLATMCASVMTTRPQNLSDDYAAVVYGGIYKEKLNDDWSEDWLAIEGGLWAICTHEGDHEYIYQTWNNLLRSWLPKSGYELRDTIHFGHYVDTPARVDSSDTLHKQIYLPIQLAEEE